MYGKALVCARFRRRREQKTISISKAFSWFKMSQNDPFPTFAWKIPRNATFFALKNMLQMDSGRKEQKMTRILIKSPGHVWKSRHRNNSDAFQNRLSGLHLDKEKAFDLKSAKTVKINFPSRRLFPCPNGAPNGPIRKVSQRAPEVFKSIRVFQWKLQSALPAWGAEFFDFPFSISLAKTPSIFTQNL